MKNYKLLSLTNIAIAASLSVSMVLPSIAAESNSSQQRPLEVTDIMKFKEIKKPALTDNGLWLSYTATPDRGDSSFHIKAIDGSKAYDIELASKGIISADGRFAAITIKPSLLSVEMASKDEKKKLKDGLKVIELASGKETDFDKVEDFQLSDNFGYVAVLTKAAKDEKSADEKPTEEKAAAEDEQEPVKLFNKKRINKVLTLVNLSNGEQLQIDDVDSFSFSPKKSVLVYSTSTEDGKANGLFARNLKSQKTLTLNAAENASFEHFSWKKDGESIAYIQGDFSEELEQRAHSVAIWEIDESKPEKLPKANKGWFVSSVNKLTWSKDGERLFFGLKPMPIEVEEVDPKIENEADLYDVAKLTDKRGLQIWHGDDALIKTNEKYQNGKDKKAFFTAVYHVDDEELVQLANSEIIYVKATNNENAVIASSDLKYRKLRTWEGFFSDFYIVDLETGKPSLIANKLSSYTDVKLSESGRYAAYYQDTHYWVYDRDKNKRYNLTKTLPVSFANEDHDYPSKVPGYGIAGWLEDDEAVLIYDKFDIWKLSLNAKNSECLTCEVGRPNSKQFRVNTLDREQSYFSDEQTLLLTSYNDDLKNFGFYQLNLANGELVKQVEENKKYKFIAKAKNADALLYSREDFNEFPDLWVSDLNTASGKKLTDVNPQKDDFLWGTPELVDWRSNNGVKHQGILIKPANYVEGMQYPVVVYYYRRFSQRMYEFNQMKVNHRPNFPFYTSNGYAIFLPDVHFEVGTPGHSTNKSILPGLQKIIDMGVADKDAIGLHGHSWSGYQTLHAITETNLFAAAVSGAPVSNMTSAYSGIRLGTGLARQFQYEQGQSRIGASLFERRDLYIENSPVFFADRITTPLLMQFGDIDDAVPWQQGVEMYMAMRRLEKEVILLQYEGEPHHLKKYPNKVDYTIKMKEYFDHYLKGAPATKWMTDGEAYRQKKD
ncbi:alpha/beta hydrolase family protein [Thalassotalea crassostreae]|uniref:alpha/beta hydrolase family protein n=1 Tax=Thalassotalea crassostreae TaxID=1763536 RepID=UPI000837E4C9|nr:prolyl oligopeptidase family serine peptidase [Thalassotalea crassostreae]